MVEVAGEALLRVHNHSHRRSSASMITAFGEHEALTACQHATRIFLCFGIRQRHP